MLFEQQPAIVLVLVIAIVEVWLRVREPRFHLVAEALGSSKSS